MNQTLNGIRRILITILVAMGVGALFIIAIGENPIDAYAALFRGAFDGKLRLGTTLAGFTPVSQLLIYGINWTFLPKPALYVACFVGAMAVAAAWAFIPAVLRAYYNVNEVCTTILMNTVALYITSYLVSGPMSAGTANAQSLPVTVRLYQFMKPSSVNVGIFIAAITVIVIIFMLQKSSWGYKIRTVGLNPTHADYVGIDSKKVFIGAMMLSGMLGGMAGCIEVLGVHGYFLNNFATGLGSNGMLAALIVKNNMVSTPFMAFFLAVLKSGAMGMQQSTGVPKSLVDTITAVFIIIATMETAFQFAKKRKKKTEEKKEDKA